MTDDITRAASATVDSGCVRFTVFFEVRGPQVFEISGELLRSRFGATGTTAVQLLTAFRQNEHEILAVARACHLKTPRPVVQLSAAAFAMGVQTDDPEQSEQQDPSLRPLPPAV